LGSNRVVDYDLESSLGLKMFPGSFLKFLSLKLKMAIHDFYKSGTTSMPLCLFLVGLLVVLG